MSQEWKDERDCLRYGGVWRDGRCAGQTVRQEASQPRRQNPAQPAVDAAAEQSRDAWMLTGRHAAYLLAEARPRATTTGEQRYDGLLLLDRARRAREMAAAWVAAAVVSCGGCG